MGTADSTSQSYVYWPLIIGCWAWGVLAIPLGALATVIYGFSFLCSSDRACSQGQHQAITTYLIELAAILLVWGFAVGRTLWNRPDAMPHRELVIGIGATAAVFTVLITPWLATEGAGATVLGLLLAPAAAPFAGSAAACAVRDRD